MLTPVFALVALVLAGAAPAAAETSAAPEIPAAVDPVTAEINALLTPYRGASGKPLRAKLGRPSGRHAARDGEVASWSVSLPQDTHCRISPATGAMRCDRDPALECRMAIAFDGAGNVLDWAVVGAPEACRAFVDRLRPA
ncbi:MAG: hypothetical protein Q8L66_04600 [Caulobacter sp.]|nr:hypothetical protein [Caulobacter sp.]